MCYAGEGIISQEPFDGAVEITQDQYQTALDGMLLGMVVSIVNGFSVDFPPQPEQAPEPEPEPNDEVFEPVEPEDDELGLDEVSPTAADVDVERERRVSDGFYFNGVHYQARPEDRENIAGAVSAAGIAIRRGVQEGDYFWSGGDTPFMWIATDNTLHAMDAQTVEAFGLAALAHKEYFIFAARRIKDMPAIPENYQDDVWWFVDTQTQ